NRKPRHHSQGSGLTGGLLEVCHQGRIGVASRVTIRERDIVGRYAGLETCPNGCGWLGQRSGGTVNAFEIQPPGMHAKLPIPGEASDAGLRVADGELIPVNLTGPE